MNKKILVMLGIYASGVVAALLYNKKTPSEIQTELEKNRASGEKDIKVLFHNFIDIHKNFLDSLKGKYLTEENKEFLFAKKDEVLSKANEFKAIAEKLVDEYSSRGKDYAQEGLQKLEKFYNEKISELEELKRKTPERIEETKEKMITYFEEIKTKFKK